MRFKHVMVRGLSAAAACLVVHERVELVVARVLRRLGLRVEARRRVNPVIEVAQLCVCVCVFVCVVLCVCVCVCVCVCLCVCV